MKTAPVLLFTFKKTIPLKRTIEALKENFLAHESELFVYSDGPANDSDVAKVKEVRTILNKINGFKKVTLNYSEKNKGLATSVIEGVSQMLSTYESIIVLEDDLITSPNFLHYMNSGLHTYRNDKRMHSISGYTVPIRIPSDYRYDNYFTRRASSWGWATWRDRWDVVDWQVSDYDAFAYDFLARRKFNRMGSDLSGMLAKQMNGTISSWAIRWCYHQFRNNLYTAYPTVSKISNIGFTEQATHTKGSDNRFATPLDKSLKKKFNFNTEPEIDLRFLKQFTAKYSLQTRAHYKIKNFLGI